MNIDNINVFAIKKSLLRLFFYVILAANPGILVILKTGIPFVISRRYSKAEDV